MTRFPIRERGVALVEFALIAPLLVIMLMVTAEMGRALLQYNTAAKGVRNAVRYLSTEAPDDSAAADRARNLIIYGSPAGGTTPIVPNLTADMIVIPASQFVGTSPAIRVVTVTVRGFSFTPMFGSVFGQQFSNFTFNDISATMRNPL